MSATNHEMEIRCFRELRLITAEMAEILEHAATHYALFPRLVAAIEVNLGDEAAPIRQLARKLSCVKGKERQAADDEWRQNFEKLRLLIEVHTAWT